MINNLQNERDGLKAENQILQQKYEEMVLENNEKETKMTMIPEEKKRTEDIKMLQQISVQSSRKKEVEDIYVGAMTRYQNGQHKEEIDDEPSKIVPILLLLNAVTTKALMTPAPEVIIAPQ